MSEDYLRQMKGRHRDDTRRLQEGIDRRMNDQRILEVLARDGFQGARYEQFVGLPMATVG
ncbi:hypothetical protein [Streptomyces sp. HC307]|uniref:hypothetical protein n=1 Tax=Streptomyces flavusporus TaxID=3385496 RepID=UPI003916FA22